MVEHANRCAKCTKPALVGIDLGEGLEMMCLAHFNEALQVINHTVTSFTEGIKNGTWTLS